MNWEVVIAFAAFVMGLFAYIQSGANTESMQNLVRNLKTIKNSSANIISESVYVSTMGLFRNKTFFKSLILSNISFLILFYIFANYDFVEAMPNIAALALGMLFLVIPDYISLKQTICILKRIPQTQSLMMICGYLFLDIILTTLISSLNIMLISINIYMMLWVYSIITSLIMCKWYFRHKNFKLSISLTVVLIGLIIWTIIDQYQVAQEFGLRTQMALESMNLVVELFLAGRVDSTELITYPLFLTTYISSVWIYLYIISLFVARSLHLFKFGAFGIISPIDIEKKPYMALGLISSLLIIIICGIIDIFFI